MTDQQHPITAPPELRRLWAQQAQRMDPHDPVAWLEHVATQASRWGADQELEACINWLHENDWKVVYKHLRAARRPKPPSLKEQALEEVGVFEGMGTCNIDIIRRALESLPD